MAKNEVKGDAYINGGRIVIIDENGTCYEDEIEKKDKEIQLLKNGIKGFLSLAGVVGVAAASNVFLKYFSQEQLLILTTGTIFSFMVAGLCFQEKQETERKRSAWVGEFNRVKLALQDKLLHLEKELVKHEKEIQEIRQAQELDFAQNFKKNGTIPKTLLKEMNG